MAKRLGRGLDSLISKTTKASRHDQVVEVPLEQIRPNPNQPRQIMDEEALDGLATSIGIHGVLQPIVLQRVAGGYELIAGERRVRASRKAGSETIPALIIEADGVKSLELALIENIQREQLGPLEEAAAFEALLAQGGMTHQELSQRVGKSRATVTNTLRLLELPDGVKRLVMGGKISAGQARAILGLEVPADMEALATAAADQKWSVREVERRVKELRERRPAGTKTKPKSPHSSKYEEELRKIYGTKVVISDSGGRGEIKLQFYSSTDRDRLIHLLLVGGRHAEREAEA